MKVFVTGGSGGIGGAIVRSLGKDNDVHFTFRQGKDRAQKLQKETSARILLMDSSLESSVAEAAAYIKKEQFDSLVLTAASPYPRTELLELDVADALKYIHENLKCNFILGQTFLKSLVDRQVPGSMVIILSSYTLSLPPAQLMPYATLKTGMLGFARSAAVEMVRENIRVNCVSPSMTRSNFISDLEDRFIEIMEAGLPMHRLAEADEIAGIVKFLLSPEASYITGVNIPVAGGQAC